jgi:hypothetical protein
MTAAIAVENEKEPAALASVFKRPGNNKRPSHASQPSPGDFFSLFFFFYNNDFRAA